MVLLAIAVWWMVVTSTAWFAHKSLLPMKPHEDDLLKCRELFGALSNISLGDHTWVDPQMCSSACSQPGIRCERSVWTQKIQITAVLPDPAVFGDVILHGTVNLSMVPRWMKFVRLAGHNISLEGIAQIHDDLRLYADITSVCPAARGMRRIVDCVGKTCADVCDVRTPSKRRLQKGTIAGIEILDLYTHITAATCVTVAVGFCFCICCLVARGRSRTYTCQNAFYFAIAFALYGFVTFFGYFKSRFLIFEVSVYSSTTALLILFVVTMGYLFNAKMENRNGIEPTLAGFIRLRSYYLTLTIVYTIWFIIKVEFTSLNLFAETQAAVCFGATVFAIIWYDFRGFIQEIFQPKIDSLFSNCDSKKILVESICCSKSKFSSLKMWHEIGRASNNETEKPFFLAVLAVIWVVFFAFCSTSAACSLYQCGNYPLYMLFANGFIFWGFFVMIGFWHFAHFDEDDDGWLPLDSVKVLVVGARNTGKSTFVENVVGKKHPSSSISSYTERLPSNPALEVTIWDTPGDPAFLDDIVDIEVDLIIRMKMSENRSYEEQRMDAEFQNQFSDKWHKSSKKNHESCCLPGCSRKREPDEFWVTQISTEPLFQPEHLQFSNGIISESTSAPIFDVNEEGTAEQIIMKYMKALDTAFKDRQSNYVCGGWRRFCECFTSGPSHPTNFVMQTIDLDEIMSRKEHQSEHDKPTAGASIVRHWFTLFMSVVVGLKVLCILPFHLINQTSIFALFSPIWQTSKDALKIKSTTELNLSNVVEEKSEEQLEQPSNLDDFKKNSVASHLYNTIIPRNADHRRFRHFIDINVLRPMTTLLANDTLVQKWKQSLGERILNDETHDEWSIFESDVSLFLRVFFVSCIVTLYVISIWNCLRGLTEKSILDNQASVSGVESHCSILLLSTVWIFLCEWYGYEVDLNVTTSRLLDSKRLRSFLMVFPKSTAEHSSPRTDLAGTELCLSIPPEDIEDSTIPLSRNDSEMDDYKQHSVNKPNMSNWWYSSFIRHHSSSLLASEHQVELLDVKNNDDEFYNEENMKNLKVTGVDLFLQMDFDRIYMKDRQYCCCGSFQCETKVKYFLFFLSSITFALLPGINRVVGGKDSFFVGNGHEEHVWRAIIANTIGLLLWQLLLRQTIVRYLHRFHDLCRAVTEIIEMPMDYKCSCSASDLSVHSETVNLLDKKSPNHSPECKKKNWPHSKTHGFEFLSFEWKDNVFAWAELREHVRLVSKVLFAKMEIVAAFLVIALIVEVLIFVILLLQQAVDPANPTNRTRTIFGIWFLFFITCLWVIRVLWFGLRFDALQKRQERAVSEQMGQLKKLWARNVDRNSQKSPFYLGDAVEKLLKKKDQQEKLEGLLNTILGDIQKEPLNPVFFGIPLTKALLVTSIIAPLVWAFGIIIRSVAFK